VILSSVLLFRSSFISGVSQITQQGRLAVRFWANPGLKVFLEFA
jgi:hypothetical protein